MVDAPRRLARGYRFVYQWDVLNASYVRDRLDRSFRCFVAVTACVRLCSVLGVAVVVLRSLFDDVCGDAVQVTGDLLRRFLVKYRADPMGPVWNGVDRVNPDPFNQVAAFDFRPFRYSVFGVNQGVLFPHTRLGRGGPCPL